MADKPMVSIFIDGRKARVLGGNNIIGPALRRLREAHGFTQEALAAKCQIAGLDLSRSTLAKIESQVRCVSDAELWTLSKVLKVPLAAFFEKK